MARFDRHQPAPRFVKRPDGTVFESGKLGPEGPRGPQGYPGMESSEVQAIADEATAAKTAAAGSETAAQQAAADADAAVLLAQQAQAAALEVPDANVSALVGNPASDTAQALAAAFAPIDEPGFDVILLAGQSNMSGRGVPYDTDTSDAPDSRVWQYGSTGRITALATEPLDMHDTPSGIGPGLGFARWYASRIAVGRRVLLVPTAHGGTGFRAGALRWKIDHTPAEDNLYLLAIEQAREALAAAGPGSRLVGILWHQGEFDSITQAGANAYEGNLDALITGFRAQLGAVPFVLGQMVPDHLATNYRAQVDAIHADTPNRVTGAAFAHGISGSFIDGDHYAALGQRFLGRAMFEQWHALSTGATITAPSTPTGLAAGTITDTSITISWDRDPAAIGYTLEWRPSGGAWTKTAVMSTRHTLTGLDPATTHLVRVAAANSAGTSAYTSTINPSTTGTPSSGMLLDDVTGALSAYSTRRLATGYAGSAIRVRRSSDSTEQDIGFTGDDLDTTALTTFVGAGDGHVVTWYDQTGNLRHLTQATGTAQPRIVIGGTVQTRNSLPVAVFDGTDDHLTTAAHMWAAGSATAALVADIDASASMTRVVSEANSAAANAQYSFLMPHTSGDTPAILIRDDTNATILSTTGSTGAAITGGLKQIDVTDTGTSIDIAVDTTATGPAAYTRTTLTADNLTVGALKRSTVGSWTPMALGELVIWGSALDAGNRFTVRDSQSTHWGTA